MSREVSEWIGSHDDQAIPPRVKVRIFQKADGKCANCGRPIAGSVRPAYDHIVPLIAGGRNRESNVQLLCVSPCHAEKTRADVAEKKLVARKHKKHIGAIGPKRKLQSRGFAKTRPQNTATRPIERQNHGEPT
jgi:5-methylcytosine-specific restriction endonuclease McrA